MHLKLRVQQLKAIIYIQYIYICIQKPRSNYKPKVIGIHTKKKKESKHNTKNRHQITRELKKKKTGEKRPTKTNPKQLTKWR